MGVPARRRRRGALRDGIRLALAGVAPIPWALDAADALDGATPLPGTAYKVEIARALVRRAVAALTPTTAGARRLRGCR